MDIYNRLAIIVGIHKAIHNVLTALTDLKYQKSRMLYSSYICICWNVQSCFHFTFLNQACTRFLEIAFVHDVGMCMCMCACVCPRGYKLHSCDMNLYNQLNKSVAFRNVMKPSIYGRGLCNEAHRDRNQSNKAMLAL